jgi:hypothetical protein
MIVAGQTVENPAAVIADAHFDVVRVPVVPSWLQKAALAVAAPVGRTLGYRPVYQPARHERRSRAAVQIHAVREERRRIARRSIVWEPYRPRFA